MSAAVIDFPTQPQPQPEPQTEGQDRPEPTPVGVLVELDPAQVAQHPDNVRDDIDPDSPDMRALTASVAEVGIISPVLVVPVAQVKGHGFPDTITHVAVDGNRRQVAAARAGLPLRCEVRDDLADAKTVVRTMLVTGTTGQRLTRRQEVTGIQRALDLGLSATKVGKALGRTRQDVQNAATVAAMRPAMVDAAEQYDLTLEQLAGLAEFEDDPNATQELMRAARRGDWDHLLAYHRQERADAALCAAAVAEARAPFDAAGVTVVETFPGWRYSLPDLVDEQTGEPIDPDQHQTCPAHAVHITGELNYDQDADGHETRTAEADITTFCLDPANNGHLSRYDRRLIPRADAPTAPRPDESEDDYTARIEAEDAARAEAAEAAAETKRHERRELIRLNKMGETAAGVRVEFLHTLMSARKHHKAMTAWATAQIIGCRSPHRHWTGDGPLATILGTLAVTSTYGNLIDDAATAQKAGPAMHGPILWAHVAAAYEATTGKDLHRERDTGRADYLRHLQDLGYVLSEPEQLAVTNAYPPAPLIDVLADLDESAGEGDDESAGTELAGDMEHADPTGLADAGDDTAEVIDQSTETA
ncbi:plasmid partitioning protein (plasmid) [Variovorax sp. PBS-H4]|uniref:ParB/RepB/Spo0J family partition protein n=1 Tax=Variovorax sp. PBS-H4 TaxID=434008 RepID=UPI0013196A74|nr:ParB N-terminal domain-containing protein [Variovorax sp. PBS-H4]VTU41375.1 plasmid partitioning protein [Variovorax sp. PBS-H4]